MSAASSFSPTARILAIRKRRFALPACAEDADTRDVAESPLDIPMEPSTRYDWIDSDFTQKLVMRRADSTGFIQFSIVSRECYSRNKLKDGGLGEGFSGVRI